MTDIIALKREIMELSEVVAASVLRHLQPSADEVSTRQAYKEFGRQWVEYHTQRQNVLPFRNGPHKNSPLVYSRRELLALKEAERRGAIAQFK